MMQKIDFILIPEPKSASLVVQGPTALTLQTKSTEALMCLSK